MSQALGIKFFDKDAKELDFKKETPIHEIKSIDLSSRPFALLSSRFFVARSASVSHPKGKGQLSVDDTLIEDELSRIADILKKENNISINVSSLRSGGSYIDFALTAFLNADIKDGALLSLEASQLQASLLAHPGTMFIIGERIEDIASEKASAAVKEVIRLASVAKCPIIIVTEELAKPASVTRYKAKIPELAGVYSLADIPLFVEPLAQDAPQSEHRRIMQMRIEKLSMRMLDELTEKKISEILKG
jgi:glycerate kinase